MRQLNGQYGLFYRGAYGGRGYVFQDRFKMRIFERRKKSGESLRRRKSDYIFESVGEVINKFEQAKGIKMDVLLDVNTVLAKRLRAELLVWLRERAGLRYKEIIKLPIFHSLRYSSLSQLYKRAKKVVNND